MDFIYIAIYLVGQLLICLLTYLFTYSLPRYSFIHSLISALGLPPFTVQAKTAERNKEKLTRKHKKYTSEGITRLRPACPQNEPSLAHLMAQVEVEAANRLQYTSSQARLPCAASQTDHTDRGPCLSPKSVFPCSLRQVVH